MIKIINIKSKEPFDIFIGRNFKTPYEHFGNPWTHKSRANAIKVSSREEAVDNYRKWLYGEDFLDIESKRREWILKNIHTLKDKTCACFCKPLSCHGDILKKFFEEKMPCSSIEGAF